MERRKTGRKVALVAGLALVVLSVGMVWTYRGEIRSWYEFRQLFESLGKNAQGYPEYWHVQTGIVFVRLPGGTFEMGSPEDEPGRWEWERQHEVTLSEFLIAKFEVSQAQWQRIMRIRPSQFTGDKLPVDSVSWEECKNFCNRVGLSLPTEAQWEYACRAGTTTAFAFGNTDSNVQANFDGGKPHELTLPVDAFGPNAWGLYNMHGNVSEWCEDTFDPDDYSTPEAGRKDPLFTAVSSSYRVLRGGDWSCSAAQCRSASRDCALPDSGSIFLRSRNQTWGLTQPIAKFSSFRPIWPPR